MASCCLISFFRSGDPHVLWTSFASSTAAHDSIWRFLWCMLLSVTGFCWRHLVGVLWLQVIGRGKTAYMIPVRPSPPPPSPPPQWFLPTPPCGVVWWWVASLPPLWCGVVWLWVASLLPVVWCGSGVGLWALVVPPFTPCGVVWVGWFPLHVWICLGCLANPCFSTVGARSL